MGARDGDVARNVTARVMFGSYNAPTSQGSIYINDPSGAFAKQTDVSGVINTAVGNQYNGTHEWLRFDASRVVPTGPAFAPRRWGALACVYLGKPAS